MLGSPILRIRIHFPMKATATLATPSLALGIPCPSFACARAVLLGPELAIVTVRSRDWGSKADAFKLLAEDKM